MSVKGNENLGDKALRKILGLPEPEPEPEEWEESCKIKVVKKKKKVKPTKKKLSRRQVMDKKWLESLNRIQR